ncbi:MAG: ribonuclease J [Candidatus Melainabacteria bacterium]|nr:ribonuclease J [Candidatus Melainabacteria bacterium]
MPDYITSIDQLDEDTLHLVPLGGQSELGQVIWAFIYQSSILLVDAGATYPQKELPGVDLLLPNTNFLEANQKHIVGLALTNGHEEHVGAVAYLATHVQIPRVMAPPQVVSMIGQGCYKLYGEDTRVNAEAIQYRNDYRLGPFYLEWIRSNNAIADASCLKISCPGGVVLYTSGFKIEQGTGEMIDLHRLSAIGDNGVDILISDSSNVEAPGYSPSEHTVESRLHKIAQEAAGRVIVVMPATNTYRLNALYAAAAQSGRKLILSGETLQKVALSTAMAGHLAMDTANAIGSSFTEVKSRSIPDKGVMVVASSIECDPIRILEDITYDEHPEIHLQAGDTIVFSSDIMPGELRHMANVLDRLLSRHVDCIYAVRNGVNVSKHAAQEELKCMLNVAKPAIFVPAIGEGRHIARHAELARHYGINPGAIFTMRNGQCLAYKPFDPTDADIIGEIESAPVLFNRDQGERVTTSSVNERRSLSLEGILTVGLTVDQSGNLLAEPDIKCGASGFQLSRQWEELSGEMPEIVKEAVDRAFSRALISFDREQGMIDAHTALRSVVRESVVKAVRSRLSAKPTVQVIVHQVDK